MMKDDFSSWEDAVIWLRLQPEQQELVKACFYDDPLEEAAERYYLSTEWRAVRAFLPVAPKGSALDIGAGRGISSYALARDGWSVTSLEPDPSDIVGANAIRRLATQQDLAISVVESWGESLPFPDDSFELVHARQVLHHANDLDMLCREIYRVLKPGGVFIATREHVISRPSDLPRFLASHPLHRLYGGENAFTLDRYREAISGSGILLTKVLATYDSDINLYPATESDLKNKVTKRLRITLPDVVFKKIIVPVLNLVNKQPGRLYTFVGSKP